MPSATVCPSSVDLQRLLRGELAQAEAQALEQHVDGCAFCQEVLQTLDAADSLVQTARAVAGRQPTSPPASVDRLMEQLAQMSPPPTMSPAILGREQPSQQPTLDLSALLLPAQGPGEIGRAGIYRILGVLGQGGMGIVFRAEDPRLGRSVALKVLSPRLAAMNTGRERFLREARAAAKLRHPAIVSLHEVGQEGALTYLVYDLVPGPNLAALLKETQPAPEQAARWVAQIADALDYAHQMGIIHRDVKPANILLDRDNQPLLSDFGLASHQDAEPTLTQEGDILGTPAYMSPEQARGSNKAIDARTDVYSLGVLLYELLCGAVPFQGKGANLLFQVIHEEPRPPRLQRSGVPADLETICLKALAKEPGRRYASAGELANDLRRYLRHEPIRARRIGPLGRLLRWYRRNPALAATVAAAVLIVAAVAGLSFRQVVEERDRFRNERDRAQENLYQSLVSDAQAQLRARDTGWWWKAMDKIGAAGRLDVANRDIGALRELAIECMGTQYPCFRLKAEWAGHSGGVCAVAYSPDGRLLATGAGDGVRLWEAATGRTLAVLPGAASWHGLRFHPAGRWLAAGSATTLRLWDVKPLQQRLARPLSKDAAKDVLPSQVFPLPGVREVAFSPDGRWLAAACGDGAVRLLPVTAEEGGAAIRAETIRVCKGHTEGVSSVAFAPDGKRLASGSEDKTVRFWDVATGQLASTWLYGHPVTALAFSPHGGLLAVSDTERFGFTFRRIDQGTPEVQGHHSDWLTSLCYDHRLRVLTGALDGALKVWPPGANSSSELAVAQGRFPAIMHLTLSPDEHWVAAGYVDGKVRLWELAEPAERAFEDGAQNAAFVGEQPILVAGQHTFDYARDLPGTIRRFAEAPIRGFAVHPDGSRFAFSDGGGDVRVWDCRWRVELMRWGAHDQPVTALAGSPDGKRLASASLAGDVKVWNWRTTALERTITPGVGPVAHLVWSRDGTHLAATGKAGGALWRLDGAAPPRQLGPEILSDSSVALGDGLVAFCTRDGTVQVQDVASGQTRQTLRGHTGEATALAFSLDGLLLASAGTDRTVRLWEARTGAARGVARASPGFGYTWLSFDPRGRRLVAGGPGPHCEASAWDLRTKTWAAYAAQGVGPCGDFLADGAGVLLGTTNGSVRLWKMADIDKARAALGPLGTEKATEAPPVETTLVVPGGHTSTIWGVAASPDGRWLATASHDETVKLWDARTLRLVRTLEGHKGVVWCVAFSPDSRQLASGGVGVKVWDVATGKELHHFADHSAFVYSIAFHPQGKWLATAGKDSAVYIREIPSGRGLGRLHQFGGAVHKLAFHPDGRWLAGACYDRHVALWRLSEGKPPPAPTVPDRRLAGHAGPVWSVGFRADGRILASGSEQGAIILWDGDSFDRVVQLKGDTAQIRSVSFSRDGRLLAGASFAGRTIVWDLHRLRQALRDLQLDW